jgi:hypothetical protein
MTENPIFWLRLVGYAHLCSELIGKQGVRIGFAPPPLNVADLLRKTDDEYIRTHLDGYIDAMHRVAEHGL